MLFILKTSKNTFFLIAEDMHRHVTKEVIQRANKHMKRWSASLVIWKMQIKATLRHYCVPIRKAKIKNWWFQVLVSIWSNWDSHSLLLRVHNGTAIMENNLVVSHKVKHRFTIWSSNFTTRYLPEKNEVIFIKKKILSLCTNAYSCFIHNYQKMATSQISFICLMGKQIVVHLSSGLLLSNKKR